MGLIHCIYVSAATQPMSEAELAALLAQACENNDRLGLTGMLLYTDGSFFQVLEGESDTVENLYVQISADPRHTHVTKVVQEPIEHPAFASWSMGFLAPTRKQLGSLLGSNDFFGRSSCFHCIEESRAKRLLEMFKDGGWRMRLAA